MRIFKQLFLLQRAIFLIITSGNFFPTQVPSCHAINTSTSDICWPSQPQEFLPESCFKYLSLDAGNHSRYFIPSKAKDLVIVLVCTTTEKDYRVVYKLPSPFLFGALIRTAPLPDRIWSNVEIGYHSSFVNQTRFTSIQFLLNQQRVHTKPCEGAHSNFGFKLELGRF